MRFALPAVPCERSHSTPGPVAIGFEVVRESKTAFVTRSPIPRQAGRWLARFQCPCGCRLRARHHHSQPAGAGHLTGAHLAPAGCVIAIPYDYMHQGELEAIPDNGEGRHCSRRRAKPRAPSQLPANRHVRSPKTDQADRMLAVCGASRTSRRRRQSLQDILVRVPVSRCSARQRQRSSSLLVPFPERPMALLPDKITLKRTTVSTSVCYT